MKQNIFSEFRSAAAAFGQSHDKAVKIGMSIMGSVGDGLVLAAPLIRNGFFHSLVHGKLSTDLLRSGFNGDPMPIASAAIYVVGSLVLARAFRFSQASYAAGSALLIPNCFQHGEFKTGFSLIPSLLGGVSGAFYVPLERKFGNHKNGFCREVLGKPKRTSGFLYLATNVTTVIASATETGSLLAPSFFWLAGNVGYFLLQRDDQLPQAIRPANDLSPAQQLSKLSKA